MEAFLIRLVVVVLTLAAYFLVTKRLKRRLNLRFRDIQRVSPGRCNTLITPWLLVGIMGYVSLTILVVFVYDGNPLYLLGSVAIWVIATLIAFGTMCIYKL
jgi:hypothetical protein